MPSPPARLMSLPYSSRIIAANGSSPPPKSPSDARPAVRNPDFTTAERIAAAINSRMGTATARAVDPATVTLPVPVAYSGHIAQLLGEIEQLAVEPDTAARILIDEPLKDLVDGLNALGVGPRDMIGILQAIKAAGALQAEIEVM
jgi:flagellar basal body P-ring protein FlgI